MKQIIGFLSFIVSYLIPANKKIFLFASTPDYCDNAYAIFRYLYLKDHNRRVYVWLVSDIVRTRQLFEKEFGENSTNIKIYSRSSFAGLLMAFRARYIFSSIGVYSGLQFHQVDKRINMWHGMPLKHIGFNFRNGDISIATSELFKPFMSRGLKIPEENIFLVGQPRNDFLFHPELFMESNLNLSRFDSVGIWMPTFRRSKAMPQHKDGDFNYDSISFISIKELERINITLAENNALLIIKFHPYDVFQDNKLVDFSNIKFLYNDNFEQKNMYMLLAHCNYLISDYSSVIVDYEILDRPIGITIQDFDTYKNTRGFDVESIPGVYLYNQHDFINFLLQNIKGEIQFETYGNLYNKYKDDQATSRLLNKLGILCDER